MLMSITMYVPVKDIHVCQRACDLMDRIVRAQEVALNSRQLDAVLDFLVKCATAAWSHSDGTSTAPSPLSSAAAFTLERSVVASALRCLGCIVYENAERCSRWYDQLVSRLLPFVSGAALPSRASPTATAGRDETAGDDVGPLPVLPLSDDTVHAALVCLGNLVLKAGSRVKDKHSLLYSTLLRVCQWGSLLPAKTLPEVEAAGRVLSSALRALLPILQAGEADVKDQYLRTSEDLLRILRDLHTFGWGCDALIKRKPKRRTVSASRGTPTRSGDGPRTPDRVGISDASGTETDGAITGVGDNSDRGSVVSGRGSVAARSRWQPPSAGPSSPGHGHSGASISGGMAAVGTGPPRGGSSWYTDSDSDDDNDGNGSESGAGYSIGAGGVTKMKRRIPVRVRVTALQCLQALARASPKLVQSRWELFIPQVQGLHPKPYTPSLLTVLLHDPSHRVQEAAASALAAVVQDAPLNRWIALPAVHNAATALATRTNKLRNNADGQCVTTALSTASASSPPKAGSSAAPSSSARPRAFNSLSDKTAAMLAEVHKGIGRGLSTADSLRFPGLVVQLLRAAGNTMAVTPYNRLDPGLARDLCGKVMTMVEAGSTLPQQVSVAALQCISLVFSNPAAVSDISTASPPPPASPAASTSPLPPSAYGQAQSLLEALVAGSGRGSGVSPIVRSEVLSVLAKAARHHAGLAAACWSSLQSLLLDSFADPSPQVRSSALRVIEEVLHGRAEAMSRGDAGAAGGGGTGADQDGLGGDDEDADDGQRQDGGGGSRKVADGGGAADAAGPGGHAEVDADTWSVLASSDAATGSITIKSLLCVYLKAAIRDVAPPVRAAAALCFSYLLPGDWSGALDMPSQQQVDGASADLTDHDAAAAPSPSPVASQPAVSRFTSTRDELLALLGQASFDAVPSVRVACARCWGSYIAWPQWKHPSFAREAAKILLCLLADDNLSVRAKASWAMGNLCAPTSASPAHAAAFAAAVTKRARGASLPIPPLPGLLVDQAGSPASVTTLYPCPGEVIDDGGVDGAADACVRGGGPDWLPPQAKAVTAQISAAFVPNSPLAPMELYCAGVSQAGLVNLLSLPLVRVVTQCVLTAAGDHDKVSCTAVRTLGYCVQALLHHWLPLPAEVRDYVNPVVMVSPGQQQPQQQQPDAPAPPAKRAEPGPCPDDDIIKASMLALADSVAGGQAAGGKAAAASSSATAQQSSAAGSASSKPLASQSWVEVGEEEDVRDIIAKRLQGPSMRHVKHPDVDTAVENGDGEATGTHGPASASPPAKLTAASPPFVPPARQQQAATGTGPQNTSKFRFQTKGKGSGAGKPGGGTPARSDAGNWRDPPPAVSDGKKGSKRTSLGATAPMSPAHTADGGTGDTPAPNAAHTTKPPRGASSSAAAAGSSGSGMKVRWNACHALHQIIPLTHRLVSTHVQHHGSNAGGDELGPAEHQSDSSMPRGRANGSRGVSTEREAYAAGEGDEVAPPASPTAASGPGGIASSFQHSSALHPSSQPSPPRPKVRRDAFSGASLPWAGVDHISTAYSPFLPKDYQMPPGTKQPSALSPNPASVAPTASNTAPSTAAPSGSASPVQQSGGGTTPQRTWRPISHASAGGPGKQSSSVAVVTDPTLPSVSIGTTWVPPMLAALQVALTRCSNFKVRIAAAQALGAVPSRASYRIPVPPAAVIPSAGSDAPLADATALQFTSLGAVSAQLSHLSPLLQRPGYDAYPPALIGLLLALEGSEETNDFTEYRYKDQLKGAIRVALVRTILLAERMDYGRMKPFFDEKADLLFMWLCAEELLVASPSSVSSIVSDAAAVLSAPPVAKPPSPSIPFDDQPVKAAPGPPFGILQPTHAIDGAAVKQCFQRLTSMFQSRVKTISTELLRRFQDKAGAGQG